MGDERKVTRTKKLIKQKSFLTLSKNVSSLWYSTNASLSPRVIFRIVFVEMSLKVKNSSKDEFALLIPISGD